MNKTDDEKKSIEKNHWGENELLVCNNSDVLEQGLYSIDIFQEIK